MTPGRNITSKGKAIASVLSTAILASLWCMSLVGCSPTEVATANDPPETAAPWSPDHEVAGSESPEYETADPTQTVDYSRFRHNNEYHSRLPCLLCHRRDTNATRVGFPGKPGHLPCAGCHTLQFSDQSNPMCTICHTNPQTGAMKRFPGLRSFGARFNHSKHMRTNCATCHKPAQRGVAKTIPAGASAHASCFQCHTSNSSSSMSSCSVCHQPGRLVRVSQSARAFRVGFSHAKHAGRNMTCATCHTVRPGTARGRQVSNPVTAMHFASARGQSCATCHNGTRAFGADDFANCRRCHTGSSFGF
jgi:c(7)-type cytochrome triheme protein